VLAGAVLAGVVLAGVVLAGVVLIDGTADDCPAGDPVPLAVIVARPYALPGTSTCLPPPAQPTAPVTAQVTAHTTVTRLQRTGASSGLVPPLMTRHRGRWLP
jgi:hypothetical protein